MTASTATLGSAIATGTERARAYARTWPARAKASAQRPEMIALGLIVLAGLVLRLYFLVQWRPALVGYPDTTVYIQDARLGIFNNPLRVGGYSEFLRLMHAIRPHLSFAIFVQHMLGLASGLLLFGTVRRAGFPRGLGLVPAAVVILGGSELFLEHAPLTEAVFIFLVDVSLYAIVRTWKGHWAWSIVAGFALGTSATVRTVGLVLTVILVPLALLALGGAAWRPRLLRAGCIVIAAALPIAGYLKDHEDSVGYGGFTGANYFDLYARVAPFAECSKFHPPAGTARLCINIPRPRRQGPNVWEFTGISPAVQVFGEPDETAPQPGENAKLRSFALAAIIGQPLDYLEAVGRDLVRIVDPSFGSSVYVGNAGYGNSPEDLAKYYFDTSNLINVDRIISEYYPRDGEIHKNVSFLTSYERATRIEGPLIAVLLLLALAAPILTTGENRRASLFLLVTTIVLFAAPVFVFEYDYRFAIPAFGPLAATAAIGAWAAFKRGQVLVAARRRQPTSGEVSHAGPKPLS